jgi:hypothetical protein
MSDGSKGNTKNTHYTAIDGGPEVRPTPPDLVDRAGLFGALWDRLRGDEADGLLVASIRAHGVREPIRLLAPVGDDPRYRLASGRGRLLASLELGLKTIPAVVLDTNEGDAVVRGIMEHYPDRRYSAAQAAVLSDLLVNDIGVDRPRLTGEVLGLLGFSGSKRVLDDLLDAAGLGDDILALAHERGYSLRILVRWARFAATDREDIASLLRRVRLGSGPADEVLGILKEISVRDVAAVKDILDAHEVSSLLGGDDEAVLRRGEELRATLRSLRYPRFTAQKREFDRAAASLSLPKSAAIDHHPTFEGGGIGFSCRFQNPGDMEAAARFLLDAAGSDAVKKLFTLV